MSQNAEQEEGNIVNSDKDYVKQILILHPRLSFTLSSPARVQPMGCLLK